MLLKHNIPNQTLETLQILGRSFSSLSHLHSLKRPTHSYSDLIRTISEMLLCRSNASTAVCLPTNPNVAIVPRQSYDMKYSRLNDARRRLNTGGDRIQAVTLPMVTKRPESAHQKHKASCGDVSVVPTNNTSDQIFQVVVMKVSLHCQGCAGKVKKHISKMEGVTSFSIDLESKRVTVRGYISPAGVLGSISKIKKAELWT